VVFTYVPAKSLTNQSLKAAEECAHNHQRFFHETEIRPHALPQARKSNKIATIQYTLEVLL